MQGTMSRLGGRVNRGQLKCYASANALPKQFKAVKPIGDRVFVKVDKPRPRSVGGVLLPAVEMTSSTGGTVVDVGDVSMVKSGDHVIFSKFAGTDISVGDDAHVLLKEEDVIGLLPENELIPNLTPLSDRILIKCAKAENTSSGGVLLNETLEKPNFGSVVKVGTGRKKEDSDEMVKPNVEVGQTVMYSKYSGTEFEEGDDSYIVIRESDILAALA
ncbi:chaperonin 10 kd subunit-domain-containing protein [Dunaliella salina]|uniref:Chaperonin 10 kd subunit-domain-containing protein n=1 Tax=Dunaliella salina TaxID=3046 RepID=A0ABQ7GN14_DUNSA|nr:chaperonin 10 kd subunit-domain-containing protein [Dunaliella salina]|eukprot:KAF5836007.1 chaperonin 10 kd subunit-domain-containing protein [Dunaliella salina]